MKRGLLLEDFESQVSEIGDDLAGDFETLCSEAITQQLELDLLRDESDFVDLQENTGEATIESLESLSVLLEKEDIEDDVKYETAATLLDSFSSITGRSFTIEVVEVPTDADVNELQDFTTEFLKDIRRKIGITARRVYRSTAAFMTKIKVIEGYVNKLVGEAIAAANSGDGASKNSGNTFKHGRIAEWIASTDDLYIKLDTFTKLREACNSVGSGIRGSDYDDPMKAVNGYMDEFANASKEFGSVPTDGVNPASIVIPGRKGLLAICTAGVIPALAGGVLTYKVSKKLIKTAKIVTGHSAYFNPLTINKVRKAKAATLAAHAIKVEQTAMGAWGKIKGASMRLVGKAPKSKVSRMKINFKALKLMSPRLLKAWGTIGKEFAKASFWSTVYLTVGVWVTRRIGGYFASRQILPLTWSEMKKAKEGLVKLMAVRVNLDGLAKTSQDLEKLANTLPETPGGDAARLQKDTYSAMVKNLGTINRLCRQTYARSFDYAKATSLYIIKSAKMHRQFAGLGTTEAVDFDATHDEEVMAILDLAEQTLERMMPYTEEEA